MTKEEKELINELKSKGLGYKAISKELNIPLGTVKSVVRRGKLEEVDSDDLCKQCGKKLVRKTRSKKKIFCSKTCCMTWWNANLDKVNRKAFYNKTCAYCGRPFTVYGRVDAKYCSLACYRLERGKHDE